MPLLACAWLGCATPGGAPDPQPLVTEGATDEIAPDPLATTPAMERAAQRFIGRVGRVALDDDLFRLRDFLLDDRHFPFTYDPGLTLTAAEAFEQRQGNCVSFTNLFIAMARSVGLPVSAAVIPSHRESSVEGPFVVVNDHVVAVFVRPLKTRVFDFAASHDRPPVGFRILDDREVRALYVNNKGAEFLKQGALEPALERFELAVELAPEFVGAWGNLGVTRRRLGDTDGAIAAYQAALELSPTNPTILNNLSRLYAWSGQAERSAAVLEDVSVRQATPHELMLLAARKLESGDAAAASQLYRRAARLDDGLAGPHVALARIALAQGRRGAAARHVERALSAHPDHREAEQMRMRLAGEDADPTTRPKPVPARD